MEFVQQHNLMEEIENAIEVKSAEKLTELRSSDVFHCRCITKMKLSILNFKGGLLNLILP